MSHRYISCQSPSFCLNVGVDGEKEGNTHCSCQRNNDRFTHSTPCVKTPVPFGEGCWKMKNDRTPPPPNLMDDSALP